MILDASSILSQNQAITATATSTYVYDTAGLGVGNAVSNIFGNATVGSNASFGEDIGGGGPLVSPPQLVAIVGTTFTAGGSATMQVQLQAAVDTNNTGTPSTWNTIIETDTLAVALLTSGRFIARFTVPERYPGQGFPRFYRLNYVVATGPMTAGTIAFAGLVTGIDGAPTYPANY